MKGWVGLAVVAAMTSAAGAGELKLRSRVAPFKGADEWSEVEFHVPLEPSRTALILCDLWDKHWCRGATERVNGLVQKVAPVVERARQRGVLIIHAPSETMEFYLAEPGRRAMLALEKVPPPQAREIVSPPLPIDDSDGGCDTPDQFYKAWSRQHPAIRVDARDLISDRGDEVFAALKRRGIELLLVAGVHTNMCILNRSFAIKQMSRWGVRCVLLRDLTDAMYDPKDRPYVPHEEGTRLVVEHIEKHWAPTALSADLVSALR